MRYCVRMPALTLSVVIPVYNEEKYLKRCIDALLDQGESVNEIVIVDNNSSDESLSILKKYAEKFEKNKSNFRERSWCGSCKERWFQDIYRVDDRPN